MSKLQNILDSFKLQDQLNPKIWNNPDDVEKSTLKEKVKKGLFRISEEFIDDLGENVPVKDVVLMGSLANYNWSKYSDFDLHVLVDFKKYKKDEELYRELFELKKKVFNDKHDIKIYGYDVELYAQGEDDPHSSSAVYSIIKDEWIQKPKKEKVEIDFKFLKKKIECWVDKINDAIESEEIDRMKNLKEKIKDYRKSGLEKDGELSYENLVFKYLRRSGDIGNLFDKLGQEKDKKLSIEQKINE